MVNRGIKKYKAQKSRHFNVGVSSKTRGEYIMKGPRGYIICESNKRCADKRFTISKFSCDPCRPGLIVNHMLLFNQTTGNNGY